MKFFFVIIFISFLNISISSTAELLPLYESFRGCGLYWVAGIVRITKVGFFIVINENTGSEFSFKSSVTEELKLAPYVDRPMRALVVINQKINGTLGKLAKVDVVKDRIPDPLFPMSDTGFKRTKKLECK
jgi:hypothetical protein